MHTIPEDATVFAAIRLMDDLGVGSLLVTHGSGAVPAGSRAEPSQPGLAGIVTERDYLRRVALRGRSSRETLVGEIMTRRVAFVGPACPVDEALAIMTEIRCRHLPVLDDGQLAGLVSIGDCVRQVIAMQQVRIRYLEDYIADAYPGPASG